MELGNFIFGNSRGNYEIVDRDLFQEIFSDLEKYLGESFSFLAIGSL